MDLRSRFLRKINKTETCWLWTGAVANGYGTIRNERQVQENANRVSFRLFHGPIPQGMHILHSCDVKLCVNPNHLSAGTRVQNIQEALERGLMHPARGEQSGRSKLTESMVLAIRKDTRSSSCIARELGLGINTVDYARKGRTWKHVLGGVPFSIN